jgi:hypothetical protein
MAEGCCARLAARVLEGLLVRAIAFQTQKKALGGLPPRTVRLLRSLIKPGVELPRQVKVGSVIVREHKGVVHEGAGRSRRILLAGKNL